MLLHEMLTKFMKKSFQKFNVKRLNQLKLKKQICSHLCLNMLVNSIHKRINLFFLLKTSSYK